MIQWLYRIIRRVTGISTPFGGISWNSSPSKIASVPTCRGPICITFPGNEALLPFLNVNESKIVFLDAQLDASTGFPEQFEMIEREKLDLDLIASGNFSGVPLPLPKDNRHFIYMLPLQ